MDMANQENTEQPFIYSPLAFQKDVESLVETQMMTYLEAITHLSESKGLEPKTVKKLLNQSILDKLENEARALNLLPKRGKLPFLRK